MGWPQTGDSRTAHYGSSEHYGPHLVHTYFGDVFLYLGSDDNSIIVSSHEYFSQHDNTLAGSRKLVLRGVLDQFLAQEWTEVDLYSRRFISRVSAEEREKVLRLVRSEVAHWVATHPEQIRAAQVAAAQEKARVIRDSAEEARRDAQEQMDRAQRLESYAAEADQVARELQQDR